MKKILGLVVGLLFTLPAFATDLDPCRNLFDNVVEQGTVIDNTNESTLRASHLIPIKAGQSYTFSLENADTLGIIYSVATSDEPAFNWTKYRYAGNDADWKYTSYTFIPTQDAYLTVSFRKSGEDSFTPSKFAALTDSLKFQIEEGSTATAYEPYNAACWAIKVATKKYNDTAFSPVVTALNSAISTIKSVVTNTINQAAAVSALQTGKQTMPNASGTNGTCPNYKQCLLVETSDGTPQWFVITDPVRDFMMPLFASGTNGNSSTYNAGYTQLEYIESTGTQYIDLNTGNQTGVFRIVATLYATGGDGNIWQQLLGYAADGSGMPLGIWMNNSAIKETFGGGNGNVIASTSEWQNIDITNSKSITIPTFYINAANPTLNYGFNSAKFKKVQLYKNNTLVRDMVPVIRNSDSAIGMYDKVNNTFYANVGSGTFTAGPMVANDDKVPGMTWTATWTASGPITAGTVYGEAKCNAISPSTGNGDPATSAQLNSSGWNTEGINCWCRMTGISVNNQFTGAQSYGQWIDNSPFPTGDYCRRSCADRCVSSFRYSPDYRRSMVKM